MGIQQEQSALRRIDQQIGDTEQNEQQLEAEYKKLVEEKKVCESKLDQEMSKNTKYLSENSEKELTLRAKNEEIAQIKQERDKMVKFYDALKRRLTQLEEDRKELEG